jgi:hypothetical protein
VSQDAIRIRSAGAVFWAEAMPDGSGNIRAIVGRPPALKLTLTGRLPPGITAKTDSRGLLLLSTPLYYDHTPTEAELAAVVAVSAVTVSGAARSLDGRFHPRRFSVTPSPASPSYVALRPSLQATGISEAGAVVFNVKWQTGAAASWCVLRLTCVRNGVTLGFSGQADGHGDAIIPLTGLPPLPPSQTTDTMTLTARGDPAQSGQEAADPDTQNAVRVSIGSGFAAQQTFPVARGKIATAATLPNPIPGLTLQPI